MEQRWYQQRIVPTIFDYFTRKDGNPVIAWPTGIGKSYIPAMFIIEALRYYPSTRAMVVTHVKELIEQNAKKLRELWPSAPIGIFSAGLGQRDTAQPIIFGGIASVRKCAQMFGHRDILFIDECHLLSIEEDTMYMYFIAELRKINPYLKVIGLSATPFRMGQGMLTDGGLFTDIIDDLTGYEMFNRLIAEGYLSQPVPRPTKTKLDVSKVSTSKGEFVQKELQTAVDVQETTYKALAEICEYGQERQSWLIFASGIDHAEHIAQQLQSFGVRCAAVHNKTKDRESIIQAFKRGDLRAISNNNVLTTGFDYPPIDLIGMLRPTLSASLWVQMIGRGTRPSPETNKQNCLVLDFARNTERLGPINEPSIPRKKGDKPGDVPVKICENCGTYNHARAVVCILCKEEFQFKEKIVAVASTAAILKTDGDVVVPDVQTYPIEIVNYSFHQKDQYAIPVMKVQYVCGANGSFNEFQCPQHTGFARKKFIDWWRQRTKSEPPTTTVDAMSRLAELKVPRRVRVQINKKFPEVLNVEY